MSVHNQHFDFVPDDEFVTQCNERFLAREINAQICQIKQIIKDEKRKFSPTFVADYFPTSFPQDELFGSDEKLTDLKSVQKSLQEILQVIITDKVRPTDEAIKEIDENLTNLKKRMPAHLQFKAMPNGRFIHLSCGPTNDQEYPVDQSKCLAMIRTLRELKTMLEPKLVSRDDIEKITQAMLLWRDQKSKSTPHVASISRPKRCIGIHKLENFIATLPDVQALFGEYIYPCNIGNLPGFKSNLSGEELKISDPALVANFPATMSGVTLKKTGNPIQPGAPAQQATINIKQFIAYHTTFKQSLFETIDYEIRVLVQLSGLIDFLKYCPKEDMVLQSGKVIRFTPMKPQYRTQKKKPTGMLSTNYSDCIIDVSSHL